jgi:tryptophan synthase alpha chain
MSRIRATFDRLKQEGRTALMPYLMVGYPQRDSVRSLAPALVEAGADLFELGVPFSDPLADGATVQRAGERALHNGIMLSDCISTVTELRNSGLETPLVLMSYFNPILQHGIEQACAELANAGGDGWIVPDLPPEEAQEMRAACNKYGLDLIMFVAPTTTDERIVEIAQLASGFIYCVALTGTTGARKELWSGLGDFLARVRRHTDTPLVVGFGISTPAHVETVSKMADGAIVASALLNHIDGLPEEQVVPEASAFVRAMSAGRERN